MSSHNLAVATIQLDPGPGTFVSGLTSNHNKNHACSPHVACTATRHKAHWTTRAAGAMVSKVRDAPQGPYWPMLRCAASASACTMQTQHGVHRHMADRADEPVPAMWQYIDSALPLVAASSQHTCREPVHVADVSPLLAPPSHWLLAGGVAVGRVRMVHVLLCFRGEVGTLVAIFGAYRCCAKKQCNFVRSDEYLYYTEGTLQASKGFEGWALAWLGLLHPHHSTPTPCLSPTHHTSVH